MYIHVSEYKGHKSKLGMMIDLQTVAEYTKSE